MIRKGTALLLSALLLASAMPFAVSAEEVSAKTTEYVNFRTGPGTNYSSKGVTPSGTGITVIDTSNSEWYAVRLSDGSTGYIYAEYISVSGSNTTEDGEVNAKTTADVNFRSGPGTNYNSKAVIGSGTGIIVTDTEQFPVVCRAPYKRLHRLYLCGVYPHHGRCRHAVRTGRTNTCTF